MDTEKLRTWIDTLERIQGKLPGDISYSLLESYGELLLCLKGLLQNMERVENKGKGA